MEMTRSSTLGVPQVSMNADPTDAIPFPGCRFRSTQTSLPDPSFAVLATRGSQTLSEPWYDPGEGEAFGAQSLRCQRLQWMRTREPSEHLATDVKKPSLCHIAMNVYRFIQQAAVSCGWLSRSAVSSREAREAILPRGVLLTWLQLVANDETSRPIIDLEEVNRIAEQYSSRGTVQFRESAEEQQVEQAQPGSLAGYVRVPSNEVRISKYPEPEQFDWDPAELRAQLAVEEFYEPSNADLETP